MERVLVFTATYNEADMIETLIQKIFKYLPEQEILVVDDSSPDGTGVLLDQLAMSNAQIHVIHRPNKLGLGTAHKLAMKYAVHQGFDVLVTMDADFSHNPKYLPILIEHLCDNDFVIGSRYMKGGKSGYGFFRSLISRIANVLSRCFLGIKLKECTTSYRGFRVSLLKKLNIDAIRSNGYSFFMESILYVSLLTNKIKEFPIYFEDRRAGASKISKLEIGKGILTLVSLSYKKLFFLKSLKKAVGQDTFTWSSVCMNCGSPYHIEIYPSTTLEGREEHIYRCTSHGHKSHGRIVKCLQCNLIYTDTQMSLETINRIYSSVKDPIYVENIEARYRTFRYNLSKIHCYLPSKGRLLDVGSYCGLFLKIAQEFAFETLGVEPSEWAVKYSRDILGQKVIQGTIMDLPDGIESFDVITLWDVLEHLPNPLRDVSLIHRKLKPGGMIVFSTLNIENWFPKIMEEHWPWFIDMHLYYFSKEIIKEMLSNNGFKLVHSERYCHIITVDYFLSKLESLGIWGAKYLKSSFAMALFKHWYIPFRFGDIQLFIAQKIEA